MRMLAICISMCLLCSWAFAGDLTAKGVVIGTGSIYINGHPLTNGMAIFTNDVLQTDDSGVAQINGPGSSLMLQSNTVVRIKDDSVALDRGTVSVATGRAATVVARDFRIKPVSQTWTQFDVVRAQGGIDIFARKRDVTVNCGVSSSTVVKEGQHLWRRDAADCGLDAGRSAAPTAAKGPILSSPTAQKAALGAAGALTIWAITKSDDAISPDTP